MAYLFRHKVQGAQRVELVAYLAPKLVYNFVLFSQLVVPGIHGFTARSSSLVFVFVYLREGSGRLSILEFKVSRRQKWSGLICSDSDRRIKVVLCSRQLDYTLHIPKSCDDARIRE